MATIAAQPQTPRTIDQRKAAQPKRRRQPPPPGRLPVGLLGFGRVGRAGAAGAIRRSSGSMRNSLRRRSLIMKCSVQNRNNANLAPALRVASQPNHRTEFTMKAKSIVRRPRGRRQRTPRFRFFRGGENGGRTMSMPSSSRSVHLTAACKNTKISNQFRYRRERGARWTGAGPLSAIAPSRTESMTAPLWISEAEAASLMDMGGAIAALEKGLALEASGGAANMVKTHAVWDGHNTLHAIGATVPAAGIVGTKTWAHTEGGAAPLLLLFDSHDGSLKAIIEAFALGQLRTGGISGVATRCLAAPGADDMALIGTGKQAITQLAAVAAVRKLRRIRIFGRDAGRRAAFVERVRRTLDLPAEEAASIEAAVAGASIITLVTRATTAFLTSAIVARGAHINAVGAITPERAEFAPDLLGRCAIIAADSVPQVKSLSREVLDYCGTDAAAWSRIGPLSAIVAAGAGRPAGPDLTLFKAMGMGISDLALGIEIYRAAVAGALGKALPAPAKATPRLKANL